MSISDAEYTAWLLAGNRERCALVEVQAYSGGAVVTRYLSNLGYTSGPADTPAHAAYDEILLDVPSLRSAMTDALSGYTTVGAGDIVISNASGERDAWLADVWEGRPVRILLGDPTWARGDFREVFVGVVADLVADSSDRLTLRVRDRQYLLDVPMLTTLIGGTGSTQDQRRPVCYGECRDVSPVLINAGTLTYAVHDGPIQAVDAVRVDGVAVSYTPDPASGTFSLGAAPSGQLTADVRGSKTGGVYVDKVADIARRIVLERTTLADVDAASVAALNADMPGAAGLYVSGDGITVIGALDRLLAGGYYGISRQGALFMALLKAPAGPAVATITDEDVLYGQVRVARQIQPLASVRLGYERRYTQLRAPAGSLGAADRQRAADEYLIAKATNTLAGYLKPREGDLQPTCLVGAVAAAAEATRRAALWSVPRRVVRLPGFLAAQQVRLGDVVALEISRYGLAGQLARVVGLRESVTGGRVELEVFL